jgi:hypothetical protein
MGAGDARKIRSSYELDGIVIAVHNRDQDELSAHIELLEQFGPRLVRPRADTLNGSHHANMKELRFDAADGFWRVAFAFDPNRKAAAASGLRVVRDTRNN